MRIDYVTIYDLWTAFDKKKLQIVNPKYIQRGEIINNLNYLFVRELLLTTGIGSGEDNKRTLVPAIIIAFDQQDGHLLKDYNGFIQSLFIGIMDSQKIYFNINGNGISESYFTFEKPNNSYIELKQILYGEISNIRDDNRNIARCISMIYSTPFPVMKTYEKDNEIVELINKNIKEC